MWLPNPRICVERCAAHFLQDALEIFRFIIYWFAMLRTGLDFLALGGSLHAARQHLQYGGSRLLTSTSFASWWTCRDFLWLQILWYHQPLADWFLCLSCAMPVNIGYSYKPWVFLHNRSLRCSCKIKLRIRCHLKSNGQVMNVAIKFWAGTRRYNAQHVLQMQMHTFTNGSN